MVSLRYSFGGYTHGLPEILIRRILSVLVIVASPAVQKVVFESQGHPANGCRVSSLFL